MTDHRQTERPIEPELRRKLSDLADRAGPAPAAAELLGRHYRRRGLRFAAVSAALLAVGLTLQLLRLAPQRPAARGTAVAAAEIEIQPLPVGAGREEIDRAVRAFARDLGTAEALAIEKSPARGISYAVSGPLPLAPAELDSAVDRLLVNYPAARIEIIRGKLSYSLISDPAESVPGRNG